MNLLKSLTGLCPIIGKIVGAVLVLVGAILILIHVPGWFWTFIIGLVMIAAGILIWRYQG